MALEQCEGEKGLGCQQLKVNIELASCPLEGEKSLLGNCENIAIVTVE
jgi:hypothetical protein